MRSETWGTIGTVLAVLLAIALMISTLFFMASVDSKATDAQLDVITLEVKVEALKEQNRDQDEALEAMVDIDSRIITILENQK